MSWDGYVQQLLAHEMIMDVAIWGKNAGEMVQWAASPGLANMTVEEVQKLAGDANVMRCSGPRVGGMKCMLLRDNRCDSTMYSMDLKSIKDEEGNTFCVCVGESMKALIIAKGKPTANAGTVAQEVYKIVNHLRCCQY